MRQIKSKVRVPTTNEEVDWIIAGKPTELSKVDDINKAIVKTDIPNKEIHREKKKFILNSLNR
jgi:hypothetical protein